MENQTTGHIKKTEPRKRVEPSKTQFKRVLTPNVVLTESNKCRQNVKTCIKALDERDWKRNRQDRAIEPDRIIPEQPTTKDFGFEIKAMAQSMRELSHHFLRFGEYLIRDEVVKEGQDRQVKNHVDIVQNNVDAAQWMAIEISHIQKLAVPIARPGDITVTRCNKYNIPS
jgi:hypothetical protein